MAPPADLFILDAHTTCTLGPGTARFEHADATIEMQGLRPAMLDTLGVLRQGGAVRLDPLPELAVAALTGTGAVAKIPPAHLGVNAFLREFFALCDRWAVGIFESAFWPAFLAGSCSRRQVMSFLAQLHHRTQGADVHNQAAAQECDDLALQPLLAQHFQEELGHGAILAKGMAQCGAPGLAALAEPPLQATQTLLRYMTGIASQPLRYVGCYGVFHAPATVRTEAELVAQFTRFAALYPYAAPGFAAVCDHSRMDYRLGHQETVLERWLRQAGSVSPQAAVLPVLGAREAAIAFRRIFDELALLG